MHLFICVFILMYVCLLVCSCNLSNFFLHKCPYILSYVCLSIHLFILKCIHICIYHWLSQQIFISSSCGIYRHKLFVYMLMHLSISIFVLIFFYLFVCLCVLPYYIPPLLQCPLYIISIVAKFESSNNLWSAVCTAVAHSTRRSIGD